MLVSSFSSGASSPLRHFPARLLWCNHFGIKYVETLCFTSEEQQESQQSNASFCQEATECKTEEFNSVWPRALMLLGSDCWCRNHCDSDFPIPEISDSLDGTGMGLVRWDFHLMPIAHELLSPVLTPALGNIHSSSFLVIKHVCSLSFKLSSSNLTYRSCSKVWAKALQPLTWFYPSHDC